MSSLANKNIADLMRYLENKRKKLDEIEIHLKKDPHIYGLFKNQNWFSKVERQISIWENNPVASLKNRDITVPEYELFRYLAEDSILKKLIKSFNAIEGMVSSDESRYKKWNASKNLLFSKNVSQIYGAIFEILILGKLIASKKEIEPYYQNIDGRIKICGRYIYFEIKSLQRSKHDLTGVGAASTQHDERQIFRALRDKAKQLYGYRGQPTLVFLSLYRLADMMTGEWYSRDFLNSREGSVISAVVLYSWFTAGSGKKIIVNGNTACNLTSKELAYLRNLA